MLISSVNTQEWFLDSMSLNLSQTKISWFGKYRWLDCLKAPYTVYWWFGGGFRWHHQEAIKNADAPSVPLGHWKWWIGIFYITKSTKHTRNNWAVLETVSDLLLLVTCDKRCSPGVLICRRYIFDWQILKLCTVLRVSGWSTPRWIFRLARHSWYNGNADA